MRGTSRQEDRFIDTVPKRRRARYVATAFHEAGHAVLASKFKTRSPERTTIAPEGESIGKVTGAPWPMSFWRDGDDFFKKPAKRYKLEREIIVLLAGREAERKKTGRYNNIGADSDHFKAAEYGCLIEGGEEVVAAYLRYLTAVTRKWVNLPLIWKQIEAVADELLLRGTIEGEARIADIMDGVIRARIPRVVIEYFPE